MAALLTGEIAMLVCLAVEVTSCSALQANCSPHFSVTGVHAVSISLMSCSPLHLLRGCKICQVGTVLAPQDSYEGLGVNVCRVTRYEL